MDKLFKVVRRRCGFVGAFFGLVSIPVAYIGRGTIFGCVSWGCFFMVFLIFAALSVVFHPYGHDL